MFPSHDHNTTFDDLAESVPFLTSENIFSEDNVLGEIDAVTVFGRTGVPDYNDTDEVKPRVDIFSDDEYHIVMQNTDNADADSHKYGYGVTDAGNFVGFRIQDNAGTNVKTDWLTVDENDVSTFSKPALKDGGELTISSGVITVTSAHHSVDTEGDASTDDLDTINGGTTENQLLVIRAANSTRDVVLKDNTGNLRLNGDFTLTHTTDTILLMWIESQSLWAELSRTDVN
jgi:hypothetical protein